MSEMLANNYFIVRDYAKAREVFLQLPEPVRDDCRVLKKLILCEIFLSQPYKALHYLLTILRRDPAIIIKIDIDTEDCPCRDLIIELEERAGYSDGDERSILSLAMLWLYCNLQRAMEYLDLIEDPENKPGIPEFKFLINKYLTTTLNSPERN